MTYRKLLIMCALAILVLMVTCTTPFDMHFSATAQNKPAASTFSDGTIRTSMTLHQADRFIALLKESQIADDGIKNLLRDYRDSANTPSVTAKPGNILIGTKQKGQGAFDVTREMASNTSNFFNRDLKPIEIAFPGLLDEATYANVLTGNGNTNILNRSFYALPNSTSPAFTRITSSPSVTSGAINTITVPTVTTPLPGAAIFMITALLGAIVRWAVKTEQTISHQQHFS